MSKELLLVGDKVLIEPDEGEKTESGLYLPQNVREKEKVQTGKIVQAGPGYPVYDPALLEDEPWSTSTSKKKYFPLQAKTGDYCIFLRDQAIEITFNKKTYMVASQSAILVLMRDSGNSEINSMEP
ncbi:MAG: co-chaperone GroES family protein [Candidatus Omnitrophica bacterium]|nr:co-chaperone GroES family protein [Candidatus Omnitrophota bacterium]